MHIEGLRVRIRIQKQETIIDKYGNHKSEWTDYFRCWATPSTQTGQEGEEAAHTKEEDRLDFTVRFGFHCPVLFGDCCSYFQKVQDPPGRQDL